MTGIAAVQGADGPPELIPAAACDYTTGYLAALGTMAALLAPEPRGRQLPRAGLALSDRDVVRARAPRRARSVAAGFGDVEPFLVTTDTPFGRLRHLGPVAQIERDASPLGAADHTARHARSRVVARELIGACGQVEVMDESTDAAVISASLADARVASPSSSTVTPA